jgi:predicted O-linked N-acetylglucosamine transferase (SPINDLY family)
MMKLIDQAVAAHRSGNLSGAESLYRQILVADKGDFDALHMLGIICAQTEQFEEAERLLRDALLIDKNFPPCLHNYGNVLAKLHRYQEAIDSYDKALTLVPNYVPVHVDRGNALLESGRFEEALISYDRALEIAPDFADAWLGRGNTFFKLKQHEKALNAFDKALSIKPDLANAWFGRGNVIFELKQYEKAIECYDRAIAIEPNTDEAEGMRLYCKALLCDWSNFSSEREHLISSAENGKEITPPFAFLGISQSSESQFKSTKLWVSKRYPSSNKPIWRGQRYKHDRIRLAYLSADFRDHPVSLLMAGVFEQHDRNLFETTAISFGPDNPSEMLTRLKGSFDRFIDVRDRGDVDVAKLILTHEIDIAVDLMGFTQHSRPLILAQRPSPVQVNFLGYPGTMGADYIDYLIADSILITTEQQKYYSEKIVTLPVSYMPHDDTKRIVSDRVFDRREMGLTQAGFVFCCFNNGYKLNPEFFNCWMDILKKVDGSVLWLSEHNETVRANLKKEALLRGVTPDRLVFAKPVPLNADHLSRLRLADLFLDTLPYNAHSTASDALLAGVPVLTQIGETFAGRVAASLLNGIGMPELITATRQDYKDLAIAIASDAGKLAAIKNKLANNLLTTDLFKTQLFTRHLEAAYKTMHESFLANRPPHPITVSP